MKIACVGGGPAGLYFAISMKLRDPSHEIEVFERNKDHTRPGGGRTETAQVGRISPRGSVIFGGPRITSKS